MGQSIDPDPNSATTALLTPATFLALALLPLLLIAAASRRWPTGQDLALRRSLSARDLVVVAAGFIVSHLIFWALSFLDEPQPDQTTLFFEEMGLAGPLAPAVAQMLSVVILAPVCEELLYRGFILRPTHDALARRGARVMAVVVSISVSTLAFALPHIGDDTTTAEILGYLVTGITFGLVYVLTGSMTAVMVAHSLQSAWVMAQVLLFGHGGQAVSPVHYILAFGAPVFVYLIAQGLRAILPSGERPVTGHQRWLAARG